MLAALLATSAAPAQGQTPAPAAGEAKRTVVTSSEQLPRRTVKLARLPSEYLAGPREPLRALQDKPGPRATTGVLALLIAEQQTLQRDAAWVRAEVEGRYGALNWAEAGDSIKASKGPLELLNPAVTQGAFQQQVDVMARNMNMDVPESMVMAIVGARVQLDHVVPLRSQIVAGLQAVIDRQAPLAARPDIWTPRLFAVPATATAAEVGIGIWDSGVDLSLFKVTPGRGIAFDRESQPAQALLRPLGDAEPRWPQLRELVKGAMDLRSALDTAEARRLREVVATLKPEQVKAFQEDLRV
jgi:hypothetical protein